MNPQQLIEDYLAGPGQLWQAVEHMSEEQLDARPIPGKWSTRQVIAHIADFEPVYADRIARAIAEENPTVFGGDPDQYAAALAYDARDLEEELQFIEATRKHVARILTNLPESVFQRTVNHSVYGTSTIEWMLEHITEHIPHHIKFIEEKRAALV